MSTKTTPDSRITPADRLSSIGSVVSHDAKFEGDFLANTDQGIKIDGILVGSVIIESGGTIHIGPSGIVQDAHLEADYIFVEGKVYGSMIARKSIEIAGTSTVIGDISYADLIDVHARARIRGRVEYSGEIEINLNK